jgi:hypothetical protein
LLFVLAFASADAQAQSQTCEITGEGKICPGESTKLCGPDGAVSYQWNVPGSDDPTTQCIDVSEPAWYGLIVTWPDGSQSECFANVEYTDESVPCSISGNLSICEGGSTELCGPEGAGGYEWIGPSGPIGSDRCIVATEPGDYTLILGGDSECSSTCTETVVLRTSEPCEIKGDARFCIGESGELCGPDGGSSYSWSGPGDFSGDTQCVTVTEAGEYTLEVSFAEGCATSCKILVETEDCRETLNCARTPGFWSQQCAQREGGSTKFDADEMQLIAARVDELSDYFDWTDGAEFAAFCGVINQNSGLIKQSKRHFAAFLANFATGELGLIANNGEEIFLDLTTPVDCGVEGVETLGDLLEAADDALANGSEDLEAIKDCLDAANNNEGIGEVCEEDQKVSKPLSGRSARLSLGAPGGSRLLLAPNPFKLSTMVQFAVPNGETRKVEIGVYDVSGRRVSTLASGEYAAGIHSLSWDGKSASGQRVANGVYYVRAQIGTDMEVQRVLFVK